MVEFAGWEMPVYYSGILVEHRAVREQAGLFDVSHMGEIEIRGPGSVELCQRLVTRDVSRCAPGRAQYSPMCYPSGGIVDDVIYTRLEAERFLFCVNAANTAKDLEWMRREANGVEVEDRSDTWGLLALQGPRAAEILEPLARPAVGGLARFAVCEATIAGIGVLVSRTGYTGEDGFELYVDAGRAEALWDALLDAGAPLGLVPAGLGARDTLRLEMGYVLYGADIDAETTPLEAGLEAFVCFDKPEFLGREALLRQRSQGVTRRLVGLELAEGAVPRRGYAVFAGGRCIGRVTSGTKSPMLGRGIALGYVEAAVSTPGTVLEVEIRGRRTPARVVEPPFYVPTTARRMS
jgi:aminomethyltransferase